MASAKTIVIHTAMYFLGWSDSLQAHEGHGPKTSTGITTHIISPHFKMAFMSHSLRFKAFLKLLPRQKAPFSPHTLSLMQTPSALASILSRSSWKQRNLCSSLPKQVQKCLYSKLWQTFHCKWVMGSLLTTNGVPYILSPPQVKLL